MKTIFKTITSLALAALMVVGSTAVFSAAAAAPKLKTLGNAAAGISVKWNAVKSATAYEVYSKVGNGAYKKLASVKKTAYTHTSVKHGKRYAYKVRAVVNGKKTKFSAAKALVRVNAPAKVALKNVSTGVKVSWTKVKNATKYVVAIKDSNDKSFSVAKSTTKTSYIEQNITAGDVSAVKVKAYIKTTAGAFSKEVSIQYLTSPQLHAEEKADLKGITLEWTPTKGAKSYVIYRSIKSENKYTKLTKITKPFINSVGSVQYEDFDLKGIESYKYYVVAYNGTQKSARSNVSYDVFAYYEGDNVPLYLTISKGIYRDIHRKLDAYGAVSMVSWSTSNAKIVKVDKDGYITGVSKGKATLTATGTYNGKHHKINIIVTVK